MTARIDPHAAQASTLPPTLAASPELNRWVRFEPGRRVRLFTGKVELGQGILSAIAQMAAEELDVDYNCIEVHPVDSSLSPNEGSTSGSRSIQEGGEAMRQACAEVRHLFSLQAAKHLRADWRDLVVMQGNFMVSGTERSISYWDLAQEVDLTQRACARVAPKAPADHHLVGQALPRKDLPSKLRGGTFLHDMQLPGMVHARIVRPPGVGAVLKHVDETATRALPGVIDVIRDGSFLGVVAQREEQAIRAMQRLARDCQWQMGPSLPDTHTLHDHLRQLPAEIEALRNDPVNNPRVVSEHSATFTRPYLSHASIGPSCGLAWWHNGQLEVWSASQSIHALRDEIAKLLQLTPQQVVARHAEGSGCYGHNGADDVSFDAALLAMALPDMPVRVQWMREDEFAWEPQGPAMVVQLSATLDADGRIANWDEHIWGNRHIQRPGRRPEPGLLAAWHQGEGCPMMPATDMPLHMGGGSQRNAVPYYDLPAMQVTNHAVIPMPVRVSALRALGAYLNVFAIESFMDELALASGQDPVSFRLRHLSDPRARAVIEAVVRRAQWQPGSTGGDGHGVGLAFARYKNIGNYAAVIAEVELTERVCVKRVVAAVDCGCIVNPDGVLNQLEGGIVQVTSWVLKEQVQFDEHQITSTDWDHYPILRFSELPRIEIELISRPEEPSLGVGEGVTGPTAAAIGNAVYNALGVRVRDLPLQFDRIVQAMS
jgi:CO/xanthine dehydrogenase Mo-binding subunit